MWVGVEGRRVSLANVLLAFPKNESVLVCVVADEVPEIDKLQRMAKEILAQPNAAGVKPEESKALFQLEIGYSIYETLLKVRFVSHTRYFGALLS